MPLIVFHTQRVRDALKAPAKLYRIGPVLALLLADQRGSLAGCVIVSVGRSRAAHTIKRSRSAYRSGRSPKYTFFSLARGFAAVPCYRSIFTLLLQDDSGAQPPSREGHGPRPRRAAIYPGSRVSSRHCAGDDRAFPDPGDRFGDCLHRDDLHRAGVEHGLQFLRQPAGNSPAAA